MHYFYLRSALPSPTSKDQRQIQDCLHTPNEISLCLVRVQPVLEVCTQQGHFNLRNSNEAKLFLTQKSVMDAAGWFRYHASTSRQNEVCYVLAVSSRFSNLPLLYFKGQLSRMEIGRGLMSLFCLISEEESKKKQLLAREGLEVCCLQIYIRTL